MKTFLLILIFLPIHLFAQSDTITWGPTFEKRPSPALGDFHTFAFTGDEYYLSSMHYKSTTLYRFDADHQMKDKHETSISIDENKVYLRDAISTRKGMYANSSKHFPKVKEWKLYAGSFKDGRISDFEVKIDHQFDRKLNDYHSNHKVTDIQAQGSDEISVSPNGSLAVHTIVFDLKKNRSKDLVENVLALSIFDDEMQVKRSEILRPAKAGNRLVLQQKFIADNGAAYLLLRVEPEKLLRKRFKDLPEYTFKFLKIEDGEMINLDLKISDSNHPKSVAFIPPDSSESQLTFVGLYTDKKELKDAKGFFSMKKNLWSEDQDVQIHPFSQEFLKKHSTRKNIRKGYGLPEHYEISQFFKYSNGHFGVIIEDFEIQNYTFITGGIAKEEKTYFSRDLIIPVFNPNGDLINTAYLPKFFGAHYQGVSSFAAAMENDMLYFIYNDFYSQEKWEEILNSKEFVGLILFSGSPSSTYLTAIDSNGAIVQRKAIYYHKGGLGLSPMVEPLLVRFCEGKFLVGKATFSNFSFGIINISVEE